MTDHQRNDPNALQSAEAAKVTAHQRRRICASGPRRFGRLSLELYA
jgi:hypothetical protein